MLSRRTFLTASLALGTGAALAPVARAGISTPGGRTLLTVTGAIRAGGPTKSVAFDLAMLDDLAQRVAKVRTPWTDGEVEFSGPLGSALLDAVGAEGATLRITALNDYAADVPAADFRAYPVMLATRVSGRPIPVREKGPIFVIYPFDVMPSLYTEATFAKSVWQVKSIDVL